VREAVFPSCLFSSSFDYKVVRTMRWTRRHSDKIRAACHLIVNFLQSCGDKCRVDLQKRERVELRHGTPVKSLPSVDLTSSICVRNSAIRVLFPIPHNYFFRRAGLAFLPLPNGSLDSPLSAVRVCDRFRSEEVIRRKKRRPPGKAASFWHSH